MGAEGWRARRFVVGSQVRNPISANLVRGPSVAEWLFVPEGRLKSL
jgi:hypothetical protein